MENIDYSSILYSINSNLIQLVNLLTDQKSIMYIIIALVSIILVLQAIKGE